MLVGAIDTDHDGKWMEATVGHSVVYMHALCRAPRVSAPGPLPDDKVIIQRANNGRSGANDKERVQVLK